MEGERFNGALDKKGPAFKLDLLDSSSSKKLTNANETGSSSVPLQPLPSFGDATSENNVTMNEAKNLIPNSWRKHKFLFDKYLSITDVGLMSKLIIPRKAAESFFPPIKSTLNKEGKCEPESVIIVDKQNNSWEMKFEYWPTNNTYALTKGWRSFASFYKLERNTLMRFYELDPRLQKPEKHYGIGFSRPFIFKKIRLFGKNYTHRYKNHIGGSDDDDDDNDDIISNDNDHQNDNGASESENQGDDKAKGKAIMICEE